MYSISLTKEAAKFYKKVDFKDKKRLNKCFKELKNSPEKGVHIKKLQGKLEGYFRFRIGGLRVIYSVDNEIVTVIVVAIGNRGDVYK